METEDLINLNHIKEQIYIPPSVPKEKPIKTTTKLSLKSKPFLKN